MYLFQSFIRYQAAKSLVVSLAPIDALVFIEEEDTGMNGERSRDENQSSNPGDSHSLVFIFVFSNKGSILITYLSKKTYETS